MSTDTRTRRGESGDEQLTEDERETFERLADEYADEEIGEVFETVLQSSDNEEAKS